MSQNAKFFDSSVVLNHPEAQALFIKAWRQKSFDQNTVILILSVALLDALTFRPLLFSPRSGWSFLGLVTLSVLNAFVLTRSLVVLSKNPKRFLLWRRPVPELDSLVESLQRIGVDLMIGQDIFRQPFRDVCRDADNKLMEVARDHIRLETLLSGHSSNQDLRRVRDHKIETSRREIGDLCGRFTRAGLISPMQNSVHYLERASRERSLASK